MILPKAILFDLDDTIVSFNSATIMAWKKCCEDFVLTTAVEFDSDTLLKKLTKQKHGFGAIQLDTK